MLEQVFKSDVDEHFANKAPVVGIGYQPAPD
jgi:hypothetical protein